MSRALIVVDVQNDFCEGGSLAVNGGVAVAARISDHLVDAQYLTVVATRDYHIDPGAHFSTNPDYVDSWPPHCRVGTSGADFHPNLNLDRVAAVFSKGAYTAAYSGFEATTDTDIPLAQWLREHHVDAVDIVGIATDHCVRATALDARRAGFETRVLLDLTAAIAQPTTDAAVNQMRTAGVELSGTVPHH